MDRRRFLGTTILGAGGVISGIPGRLSAGQALENRDGYIRHEEGHWVIGTSAVEKVVRFEDGRLTLASFKNKLSGREYIPGGTVSNEVRFTADGQEITGGSGGWMLVGEDSHQLAQGELQLDLKLRHGPLVITKHYVAYPGSPVIREWLNISNDSAKPVRLNDPGFLETRVLTTDVGKLGSLLHDRRRGVQRLAIAEKREDEQPLTPTPSTRTILLMPARAACITAPTCRS